MAPTVWVTCQRITAFQHGDELPHFRKLEGASVRYFVGHALGGLVGLQLALSKPKLFTKFSADKYVEQSKSAHIALL